MIDKISRSNFWQGQIPEIGFLRELYVKKLLKTMNNALVKVITGQRRSGKSYLLRMLIKHLLEERKIKPENILYLNMETFEMQEITDSTKLMGVVGEYRKKLHPGMLPPGTHSLSTGVVEARCCGLGSHVGGRFTHADEESDLRFLPLDNAA